MNFNGGKLTFDLIAKIVGIEEAGSFMREHGIGDVYISKTPNPQRGFSSLFIKAFGYEKALRICKEIGGGTCYMPRLTYAESRARARDVCRDRFDVQKNMTVDAIARKYGMTSRNVRRIVAQKRKEKHP